MGATEWTPPQGNSSQFGTERPATLAATPQAEGDVKPNTGTSIQDREAEARGEEGEAIADWQARRGIDTSKQIRIVKVSHMRYQHPEFAKITKFLKDFGMQIVKQTDDKIWWRGYGPDHYVYYMQLGSEKKFLGGAFLVESYEELEKAAKLPGSTQIQEMKDAPGGGYIVTMTDPNGLLVSVIYGQEELQRSDVPEKLIQNYEVEKPRVRRFHRFTPGPAAVHKLGHFGYMVQDFDAQLDFYTRTFNLVPSDLLYVPGDDGSKKEVVTFLHVDRGEDPTDHHTVFFGTGKSNHVHHASFEVHDFDTQQLGHQWLAKQGYTPVWGVGRHILGSQVFDYWWDTTGNMIEHYADGDLVNKETPIGFQSAADEALAIWGPELPKWFLD